jgi:inner membrane protease ATP23
MREQCRMVGADIKPEHIRCQPCESGSMLGGFDPNYGIVLCSNERLSKRETEDTIAHELVHAYDWLRFKIDNTNPQHVACAEVRALNHQDDADLRRFGRRC